MEPNFTKDEKQYPGAAILAKDDRRCNLSIEGAPDLCAI